LRLLDDVPTKLVIFDRRTALLPIHGEDPVAGSLVVHAPTLVASLVALFDNLWERAVPLELVVTLTDGDPTARPVATDVSPPARARDILGLMAAGLTDDAIARALGISRRTVQKHISELAEVLGARTRFQIALLAAERGLVGTQPRVEDATA
jgi:DNA-binding NarL/FixJ family response regulator